VPDKGFDLNDFSMLMIGIGTLIGLVAILYVIRKALTERGGEVGGWTLSGAGRNITAIARTTLAEGLRARIAFGFLLLILISVPSFYFTADGDGTIKGKVQMYMTYSLGFSSFILALLTVIFACRSLSNEIASRQIYSIIAKPVPRWQILAGKWTGVMALNVGVMLLVGVLTYVGVLLILSDFKSTLYRELTTESGITPEQAERFVASLEDVKGMGVAGADSPVVTAMKEATGLTRDDVSEILLRLPEPTRVDLRRFDELRRQVLVSRATLKVQVDEEEFQEAVLAEYRRRDEAGTIPDTVATNVVMEQIRSEVWGRFCRIEPLRVKAWKLKGPAPKKGDEMITSIRYNVKTETLMQAWRHPLTGQVLEKDTILCQWAIGAADNPDRAERTEAIPVDTTKEIEFPAEAISKDGTIVVEFANIDPRSSAAAFDLPEALKVLYVVGTFETNLLQACLAALIPLASLATFGVFASTFLTFPVGSMILIFLYILSNSMGFVAESLAVAEEYFDPTVVQPLSFEIRRTVVDILEWLLSLGDLTPLSNVMEGQAIGWATLGLSFVKFVLIKGGIAMFIAVLVFRRRELAAVTV